MKNKTLLLITLMIAYGSVQAAEQDNAGTQLLKNTATSATPTQAVEGTGTAGQKLEDAKKLNDSVKSAPDALKGQAQDMATESAKEKLNAAVPEKAKQDLKTVESGTKTAKKMKDIVSKSSGEATKAIKGKVEEEATKKALDTVK